ncbi:MAG: LysR family transcriptional regulator [Polyangiales bacterium]
MANDLEGLKRARLDELAVFVEVAAAGSLAGAAKRLGLPKSTVGRAVARLEEELGATLVRRAARAPGITEQGRLLANLAAPHVGALRDLSSALGRAASEAYGTLRITAPADIGTLVLGPLVASFTARHPRVRVEVELTLRVVDLVGEGFDLAVRIAQRGLPSSSLIAKKLARMELGLYAGAGYAATRELPRRPEDLAAHDHVLLKGRAGREQIALDGPRGAVRVAVRGRVSGNDFFFLREAIASGAGIGALPWFVASAELASGRLVRVLPEHRAAVGAVAYLVHPKLTAPSPKVELFRAFLLEHGPALLAHP